jgi:hypothetical protein
MNCFDETRRAVEQAEMQIRAADTVATDMAKLLLGRLNRVNSDWVLADLKRELANFNIRTGEWKK